MSMSEHTLVVWLDPLKPEERGEYDASVPEDRKEWDRDRLQVSVECSGVVNTCRTWWECREPCDQERATLGLDPDDWYDRLAERGEAHGVEHQHINGEWMTPSDPPTCIASTLDGALDSAREVAMYDLKCEPGRYPVVLDEDCGDVIVKLAPERVAAIRARGAEEEA